MKWKCNICQKNDTLIKYMNMYVCRQCYEDLTKDNTKVYVMKKQTKTSFSK